MRVWAAARIVGVWRLLAILDLIWCDAISAQSSSCWPLQAAGGFQIPFMVQVFATSASLTNTIATMVTALAWWLLGSLARYMNVLANLGAPMTPAAQAHLIQVLN